MNKPTKPIRIGKELYHTAASASRYLNISKSTFFNYRRIGAFNVEAIVMLNGKIKLLYRQSMLDRTFKPHDLLTAIKIAEKYRNCDRESKGL